MIEFDQEAIKMLCRDDPIANELERIGLAIARDAHDMSKRTGDNVPRHIKRGAKAINPGAGYTHYDKDIEVVWSTYNRMAAVLVLATRHAILLEYGWTPVAGKPQVPRLYLTRSLSLNKELV